MHGRLLMDAPLTPTGGKASSLREERAGRLSREKGMAAARSSPWDAPSEEDLRRMSR